jgi:CRP-like cAMP-binding protein
MLSLNPGVPLDNKLLSALARDQLDELGPHLSTRELAQGLVLLQAGEEFDRVYFPHSGMLSLPVVMSDGKGIEVATVGREGVVGAMAGLSLYRSLVRFVVPMAVTMIAASRFRRAIYGSAAVRDLCLGYNEVLLQHARVTAACNALILSNRGNGTLSKVQRLRPGWSRSAMRSLTMFATGA